MGLNIIVCAKQVPDPEGPPSSFEINEAELKVTARGIPPVINPFDENALEAAMRIKESHEQVSITLISMGKGISKAVILKAVAVGADASLLVEGDSLDASLLDSFATARLLAAAVARAGGYDSSSAAQAADTNAGLVGLGLAQLLGIPAITLAQKVDVAGDGVVVERVLPDGYEVVEAPLPALVTVSGEVGGLRYPSVQAIKAAKAIPDRARPGGPGPGPLHMGRVRTVALAAPSRERRCKMVEGETPEEAGRNLVLALRQDKVI